MKRILIRMSALATVVALGLIAIAQAQRSVEDPSPQAKTSVPPGSMARAATFEETAGETKLADTGRLPGLFPDVNPLRRSGEETASSRVIPASAESAERYPTPVQAAREPSPWGADPTLPKDPFAGLSAANAGRAASTGEGPDPGTVVEMPPAAIAAPTGSGEAPSLIAPAEAGPARGAAPRVVETAEAMVNDRYGGAVSASDTREPAQFELDPGAPTSTIPNARGRAPGRYPVPELASVRSELAPQNEGTGTPGNKQLEGPQTPQLTIQKFAPEEIQVGKEATFRVQVINTGPIAAHGVEIRDEIPKGTKLAGANPEPSRGARGELVWELGTIQPRDEVSVEVHLMPIEEGEIGSVATVHFNADASVRTVATKPELAIHTSAPSQVLIGEQLTLTITVSNPGSGVAAGVVLDNRVPEGLQHAAGSELEYVVGDLKPGENKRLELTLLATKAGLASNVLSARADANLAIEDRLDIEVIAPELDVALEGPKRRYLEREATYTLSVSNPGTAPARNVELIAELPPGLDFVSANNSGQYQPASRTVHWLLEELPVQETGSVRLTAMPMEAGEKTLRFTSTAEPGLSVQGEQPIVVEGIAAILFQVVDVDDPIELGGETTYEIRVVNQGSKAATNVQLVAVLPPEMRPVAAEGPARHAIDGNRVFFEGLPRLAPKADTTYRVRVQGLQPGDLRLRVQLRTDEIEDWVIKEESTRVYSDE